MDVKQLRYFAKICEFGSFSRASEALHIAQPALSQQIANLEAELGVKLLVRTSMGTRPTEPGKTLYRYSQAIQKQVEQAMLEMREQTASPVGTVAVGLPMSVAAVLAVPLLQASRRKHPRVVVQIVEGANNLLAEMLANGRLDIALLYGVLPDRGVLARMRLTEELYLISSASDPIGAEDQEIDIGGLPNLDLILPSRGTPLRAILEAAMGAEDRPLKVVAEVHALPTLRSAVLAGLGHTVLPWSAVADVVGAGLLRIRSIAPEMKRPLAICVSDTGELSDAAARVLTLLEAVSADLLESGAWKGVTGQAGFGDRSGQRATV